MQSKKYQCLNINVRTLVVYATNSQLQYSAKNPWQKSFVGIGKNLPKTPDKNLLELAKNL